MSKHRHEYFVRVSLSYAYEGNGCFAVKFDPKEVEVILDEGEVRFIKRNNDARFEIMSN